MGFEIRGNNTFRRAATVAVSAFALVLASLGMSATSSAGPVDPRLYIDTQDAPVGVASDQVEGSSTVSYTHKIINDYEHQVPAQTLHIELAPTTGQKPSVNFSGARVDGQECEVSATHAECEVGKIIGEYSAQVAVDLHVDAEVWESQPLSMLRSSLEQENGTTPDTDTTYVHVYDADEPDVERIDFVLPETISNDLDEPGMPVRFVLNNNVGAMENVRLEIITEGTLGRESGVVIGAGSNACAKESQDVTVCEWSDLSHNEGASTEAGIWVADGFDGQWFSIVNVRASWVDSDGNEHAFAQRSEYAEVDKGT